MNTEEKTLVIKVIEDKELADQIREAIRNNGGYCCCAIEKTPDTKCMCKDFLESESVGKCHCGLYEKF